MLLPKRIKDYFTSAPKTLRRIDKKPENIKRELLMRGFIFAALCLLLLFFNLLKSNKIHGTAISEFMTRVFSKPLVSAAGRLTSWLSPLSVFECFIIFAVLLVFKLLIKWIKLLIKVRKNWIPLVKSVSAVAIAVLIGLNYYALTAGFAYNRAEIDLPMSDTVYMGRPFAQENETSVDDIADYFYQDYKRLAEKFENMPAPYNLNGMIRVLQEEYKRLDGNSYYFRFTPRVKTIKNSWFMNSVGISGIAFLPTGEANINYLSSSVSLVYIAHTAAHELAHSRGVMRENDANLLGYYILLTADDEYLRYAGYINCFSSMRAGVGLANDPDSEAYFNYPDPKAVTAEKLKLKNYWENYVGPFDWLDSLLTDIGEFFNNLYLKSNGIDDGTDSYHDFPSGSIDQEITDPDTGSTVIIPVPIYNNIQKVFFAVYESRNSSS